MGRPPKQKEEALAQIEEAKTHLDEVLDDLEDAAYSIG
jgi:hypothetical protein